MMRLLILWLAASLFAADPVKAPAPKAPPAVKMPIVPPMSKRPRLWSLQPLVRPPVPASRPNPIDAFVEMMYAQKGVTPLGAADPATLVRRVYLDLTGIPPTPAEQAAYLNDPSPEAYEKLLDRLLASEQHGVRYGRHWLDVLRYADQEELMYAAPGIHFWRDWVINAVNADVPYDQFVRAQLTGYRTAERTKIQAVGRRTPVERRPDDLFALGFLARGAVNRDSKDLGELQIAAVETVSTAFLGMTVGCAKCHDHMYDPIPQKDFYAMKALFDPLVIRKQTLATPSDLVVYGKQLEEFERQRQLLETPVNALTEPYRAKLYAERVAMLPADVQTVIRKPERARSVAEQKIADDYFPVLRIDTDKIEEIMSESDKATYKELRAKLNQLNGPTRRQLVKDLPAFWTVEVDRGLEREKSYILTSGDPERPEKNHPVEPGWPFYSGQPDLREGRVEAFTDWLTAKENPLFARVAVNRLWQWHFGEGLQKSSSDFGLMGGRPSNLPLLDWLASEFIARGYSMKQMHKLIMTSRTYRLASHGSPEFVKKNLAADPGQRFLWGFRLRRLEAEAIWDSILTAAGNLDTTLGGPSFDIETRVPRRGMAATEAKTNRRGAYIVRGFSTSREVVPNFLQAFDVDDGRAPCPLRTQTVTAPQGLFLMNSAEVEKASAQFAERLRQASGDDLSGAVDLAYRTALSRPPSAKEKDQALSYLANDASRLKNFAWLVLNLDEFIYVQ
ncbi:MAG: DUF1549 and DUF1553 domain-containing protein [Bryobacteraceae bacterium]|nr:DUF1549 and DUF1553 domain-containing protein [Bryobacteraceae bacterium]